MLLPPGFKGALRIFVESWALREERASTEELSAQKAPESFLAEAQLPPLTVKAQLSFHIHQGDISCNALVQLACRAPVPGPQPQSGQNSAVGLLNDCFATGPFTATTVCIVRASRADVIAAVGKGKFPVGALLEDCYNPAHVFDESLVVSQAPKAQNAEQMVPPDGQRVIGHRGLSICQDTRPYPLLHRTRPWAAARM